ncbi:lytic transglycosylase domain-containing protein [Sinorhizobium saheli]|uniref:Lytic transglycosylase n=1 Tax=Sinorhizobium saheli TaxID=36856 RepID=A0A178Y633_SINSA|nr:lytic transglycosylase domain-containing protein [Sinorhizobium saheli]MQW87831.1 transglycosylase SLT domain-containing protein [Sinorhizobium saheli]OAP43039.1 lytic transglycosylase [Sinorhizobium saheli]
MATVRHRARAGGSSAVRRSTLLFLLSGLMLTAVAMPTALAQDSPPWRAPAAHPHAAPITEASRRFGIPAAWIVAVMRVESAGDVRAVSSAGAMGLMQVMPDTWGELRVRYGLGRNPYDPRDNILAGTAYLREMWDRYGDVAATLAAYNAGPARYDEHRSKGRLLPAETRAYVTSLTPVLRGERPSKSGSAIARPLDWREAAIFVGRDEGAFATNPTSADRSPDDARSPVPVTRETLTAAQPQKLFVARAAAGDRP